MDDRVIEIGTMDYGPGYQHQVSRGVIPIEEHERSLIDKDTTFDKYATTKSVSQISLNTASIQMQIYTLISFVGPVLNGFQIALFVFIPCAILLQLVIYILLVVLAKASTEKIGRFTATGINATVTILSHLLVIVTFTVTILQWRSGIVTPPLPNITQF